MIIIRHDRLTMNFRLKKQVIQVSACFYLGTKPYVLIKEQSLVPLAALSLKLFPAPVPLAA